MVHHQLAVHQSPVQGTSVRVSSCAFTLQVLILSDHLHLATSAFDKCRSVRYRQALHADPLEKFKQQRKLQVPAADSSSSRQHSTGGDEPQEGQQVQQQALQQESRALIVSPGGMLCRNPVPAPCHSKTSLTCPWCCSVSDTLKVYLLTSAYT
jgi:hypothetical protein